MFPKSKSLKENAPLSILSFAKAEALFLFSFSLSFSPSLSFSFPLVHSCSVSPFSPAIFLTNFPYIVRTELHYTCHCIAMFVRITGFLFTKSITPTVGTIHVWFRKPRFYPYTLPKLYGKAIIYLFPDWPVPDI